MKKIIFLVFLFLAFTSLHAYSKKIVFTTFMKQENAKTSLQDFQKTLTYKEIDTLGKKYDFKIHTRESGKYFIVVAEPFKSKKLLQKVYNLAQVEYKDAYYINYELSKVNLEAKIVKKDENISQHSIKKEDEVDIDVIDVLLYLSIALILSAVIFFYRKFKRIYDQY